MTPLVLSEPLLAALRARRELQRQATPPPQSSPRLEVEKEHDAFLLDPGMGPEIFLTADGRILIDERDWNGKPLREARSDEVVSALVVGAQKTGIVELLELIPPRPENGIACHKCQGSRWVRLAPTMDGEVVCVWCGGLGWRSP